MKKMKHKEIPVVRERLREQQGFLCAICDQPLSKEDAVLDHDHRTGAVRAALHKSCNAAWGKVENYMRSYGVPDEEAFLSGLFYFYKVHQKDRHGLRHPTHKTEEEKRLARNKKARKRRKAKK